MDMQDFDEKAQKKIEQKTSEMVQILVEMDQRKAAEVAHDTSAFFLAFLADIGALNPNIRIALVALEHIADIEMQIAMIKRQLQDCTRKDDHLRCLMALSDDDTNKILN